MVNTKSFFFVAIFLPAIAIVLALAALWIVTLSFEPLVAVLGEGCTFEKPGPVVADRMCIPTRVLLITVAVLIAPATVALLGRYADKLISRAWFYWLLLAFVTLAVDFYVLGRQGDAISGILISGCIALFFVYRGTAHLNSQLGRAITLITHMIVGLLISLFVAHFYLVGVGFFPQ